MSVCLSKSCMLGSRRRELSDLRRIYKYIYISILSIHISLSRLIALYIYTDIYIYIYAYINASVYKKQYRLSLSVIL